MTRLKKPYNFKAPEQCVHCSAEKITETKEGYGVYNHLIECPMFTDH